MRQIHKVDQSIKIIVMFWKIRKQRTILVGVYYLSLWSMILMRSIDINGYSFYLSFHGSPLGNSYGDFLYRFILYIWVTVTLNLNCVYNYLFYRTIPSIERWKNQYILKRNMNSKHFIGVHRAQYFGTLRLINEAKCNEVFILLYR